jgi:hypothetical protein
LPVAVRGSDCSFAWTRFRIKLDLMWIVLQETAEGGLPGPPLRRWEFIGTSEAPDHVAACREVARLPGRYAAVEAHTVVIEQTTE